MELGTIPVEQVTYQAYVTFRSVAEAGRENVLNFEFVGAVGPFALGEDPFVNGVDHTLLGEGELVAGVRAVRTIPDVTDGVFYTGMLWSDIGGVDTLGNPAPFTVWYFIPLDLPTGMRQR